MGLVFKILSGLIGPLLSLFGFKKTNLSTEAQAAASAASATTQLQAAKENEVVHQQVAQAEQAAEHKLADDPDSLWDDDGHQVHGAGGQGNGNG